MPVSLSAEEARALALRAQGFGDTRLGQPIDWLDRLGAIQLDSVNVVARNHLLVPFARLGAYSIQALHASIYHDKRGFEYWGHMASWLPIADYRYFLPRMARMRASTRGWWRRVRTEHASLYPLVLQRVRDEGPLGAAAFDDPRAGRGTWWDWKPAKLVLEDLLDQGLVMCADRTAGFARLYDLTERVLPAGLDTRDPGAFEATRYLLAGGLRRLGVATATEIADYYRLKPADQTRAALASLVEDGAVVPVDVDGWGVAAFATREALDGPTSVPVHRPTLVAPFDNLLWERNRIERIFGFRYRVEIYVPELKRQYGYFT
ncbi:MAG TPA: crosslink repair DNA glycosylase YcaQ family protein, partial [Chloroflexota bacterium]